MKKYFLLLMLVLASLNMYAQGVRYPMANGNYTEGFTTISTWTNGFASPTAATYWRGLATNTTGTIPSATRITTATTTFQTTSSTSGGVQKGGAFTNPANTIVLLSTGSTDNSSSAAIELALDFTNRVAGTLSFDWQCVFNSTGNRKSSLRVYTSTDGVNYTELTSAAVLNFTNNVAGSGTISAIDLPSSFTNSDTAYIRFYYHNGVGGSTGSRPKIAFTNVSVTSTAASTPTVSVDPSTISGFLQSSATPSNSQTYSVSGVGLSADVVITPPAHYQISTDNSTWVTAPSTITLTPASGTLNATTIYVRLNSGAQGYFLESISNASTGATTKEVLVEGAYPTRYYSASTGNLNLTTSWGTNSDGTGTNPSNFTADGQYFIVANNTNATIGADWTVSGLFSKIIVGDGSTAINLTVPDPYKITGTIDITANAKLAYNSSAAPAHTYGTLSTGSTIEFGQSGSYTVPQTITYQNLILKNGTKAVAGGTTTIAGNLTLDNVTFSAPGSSPFATINLGGNLTYLGTVVNPADANSITLVATSSGTQTITGNGNVARFFRIQINNSGAKVELAAGASRNLTNALLGNASGGGLQLASGSQFAINNNSLNLFAGKTTFIGSGKIIGSAQSNMTLANSTSTQTMGAFSFETGFEVLDTLTLNISGSVPTATLGSTLRIASALNLNAGVLNVGANTLTLDNAAVISGGSASSYVSLAAAGAVNKSVSAVGTYTFPIGDASLVYSPVSVTLNSGSFSSASLEAKVSKTKQTNNTSATDYLNRFWTVNALGITGLSADVSATYNQADVAGTESNLYGGLYTGSAWQLSSQANSTANTLSFSGLSSFGDFTAGERSTMANAGSVNITVIPEGFYNTTTGTLNGKDTLTAYLLNTSAPFAIVDSAVFVIDSVNFIGNAGFYTAPTGTYYLAVKGRGALETWSAAGIAFTQGSATAYNFTTEAAQAYGNNMKLVNTKYCLYSGDINLDGSINATDLNLLDTDANNFASGYHLTDITGDGYVDFSDIVIFDNNYNSQIVKSTPVSKLKTPNSEK